MLTMLKNANLLLAFLLELCVLVALGYWGFQTGQGILVKILLGIGVPVVAIVVWGMFGAPRSDWQLKGVWYLLLKVVFFGAAIAALFAAHQPGWGWAFVGVFMLNNILLYIWGQMQ
jgi:hypothetical protein